MAVFSAETTIQKSPDEVFAYVSDMARHGEWGGHDLAVQKVSSGPVAAGSTFSSVAKQFGTQKETQTVTEFVPGKRFAFEATGALGVARHVFDLSAAGNGTRVVKSMEITKPTILAKATSFKIKGEQPKAMAQDLQNIKAKLEG
jgi:uncharacterized protein YndB with AHSA1/START domain